MLATQRSAAGYRSADITIESIGEQLTSDLSTTYSGSKRSGAPARAARKRRA
jgi:hypothetical protein